MCETNVVSRYFRIMYRYAVSVRLPLSFAAAMISIVLYLFWTL